MAAQKIKSKANDSAEEVKQEEVKIEEIAGEDAGENPETAPPSVEVVFEDVPDKQPPEKNVKVVLRVDHSCSIGGVRYHFEKGKQYNVPASVKAILLQADLLMPL